MTYRVKIVIGNNQFNVDGASKHDCDVILGVYAKSGCWWNPFRMRSFLLESYRQKLLIRLSNVDAVVVEKTADEVKP